MLRVRLGPTPGAHGLVRALQAVGLQQRPASTGKLHPEHGPGSARLLQACRGVPAS